MQHLCNATTSNLLLIQQIISWRSTTADTADKVEASLQVDQSLNSSEAWTWRRVFCEATDKSWFVAKVAERPSRPFGFIGGWIVMFNDAACFKCWCPRSLLNTGGLPTCLMTYLEGGGGRWASIKKLQLQHTNTELRFISKFTCITKFGQWSIITEQHTHTLLNSWGSAW